MIKQDIFKSLDDGIKLREQLRDEFASQIQIIGEILASAIASGNKLMLCGNGGSAADAQHIAAELIIRFRSSVNRPAVPALALSTDTSVLTACGNDLGFDKIFSRQVEGLGKRGDILIAISTSGNSKNIVEAIRAAAGLEMTSVALLGGKGGDAKHLADFSIVVPSDITARIQEAHITIGHIWCEVIEASNFKTYL